MTTTAETITDLTSVLPAWRLRSKSARGLGLCRPAT